MAKRKRGITPEKVDQRKRKGKGQGIGKDYKPFTTIQDVPSQGRSHRIHGNRLDRQHDLLSDLERDYLYIVEFSDFTVDINEQYALPLEVTELIAEEIGIKHPLDPQTKCLKPIETDFVLTVNKGFGNETLARTIKYMDKLLDKRTIEKFEIERIYWEQKGVDWGIVTEKDIDRTVAFNIAECYKSFDLSDIDAFQKIPLKERNKIIESFKYGVTGTGVVVREIASDFDEKMSLKFGTGLSIFRHLVITKQIKINLFRRWDIDSPQDVDVALNIKRGYGEVSSI